MRASRLIQTSGPLIRTWKGARVVMPKRKETVTMRRDADLLAWFRRDRGERALERVEIIERDLMTVRQQAAEAIPEYRIAVERQGAVGQAMKGMRAKCQSRSAGCPSAKFQRGFHRLENMDAMSKCGAKFTADGSGSGMPAMVEFHRLARGQSPGTHCCHGRRPHTIRWFGRSVYTTHRRHQLCPLDPAGHIHTGAQVRRGRAGAAPQAP
jgi:hypothetical protein